MNRVFTFIITLLLTTAMSAQQADGYGELKSKMLHLKEKYTGNENNSNQAIVTVLNRLCNDYPGRLTIQQYKELAKNLNAMMLKTSDGKMLRTLEAAFETLRGKSDTLDIEQRILDYYQKVPQELIYIHTDRPYYVPGDTIWFRAHLVDAVTHTPISRSKYVYVELHDPQVDTLVRRIIVKCDSNGIFANAIALPRQMHGGQYTLAAYTQWMRNFPAERFCYKRLTVVGNSPEREHDGSRRMKQTVSAMEINSSHQGKHTLQAVQRKGQLLIQLNEPCNEPLACTIYGSGNLIVTDYTPGKVLRIDCQSLRPGSISLALVNSETGAIVAESQADIERPQPQVTISGNTTGKNAPVELTIDVTDGDGKPLAGSFSLSIADYNVVKPDTMLPDIDRYLARQWGSYALSDMLSSTYPRIEYSFQTSQVISGSVRGTLLTKKIKRPKLMLVRPDTGFRETFELGDSSRFTINGLDFPDGTSFLLEGMRRTGSTRMVQLDIDPQTFPTLTTSDVQHSWTMGEETVPATASHIPAEFAKQAQEQVMYGATDYNIDLPEVVKEKKRKHRTDNRMKIEPFKAHYDDQPFLNNCSTMEVLLNTLGLKVTRNDDGMHAIQTWTTGGLGPIIYIDDVESNAEELLILEPSSLHSIEYFQHYDSRLLAYRWDGPTRGVLLVRVKPGATGKNGSPLSMAAIQQQGWAPVATFYSPQYTDISQKTRPDHRTTLYWEPKLRTDRNGHATIRFYASDLSTRYLVTLEGVSDNGTIVSKQAIIE